MGLLSFSFLFFSELILGNKSYGWKLYFLCAFTMLITFSEKGRNQFLKCIFPPARFLKIRLLENILTTIPFSIFLFLKNHFIIAIIILLLSGTLSMYNNVSLAKIRIPSPFSKNPYEFTVGFRRCYLLIITIYSLAFVSIYYHYFYLGLLSLLSLFLLCLTFYSELDPIYYVWIHAQSSKVFLIKKIKIALLYSFSLSLLIFFPLLIFYPFRAGIILLTLIVGLLDIVLGILAVYVNFPVKKTISQNIQFFLGVTIPPLLLLIIPNMYYQSVQKLKEYLKC